MNVTGECVKTHDPCGTAQEFRLTVRAEGSGVILSILGLGTKYNGRRMMDSGYVAIVEMSLDEANELALNLLSRSAGIPKEIHTVSGGRPADFQPHVNENVNENDTAVAASALPQPSGAT